MQVRQRHFGSGYQPQVVFHVPIQVICELGKLTRAHQAPAVHHERRIGFHVAVLGRVQVEHPVDQRPLEPDALAEHHVEARAAQFGAPFEVQDAQLRAQLPVGPGLEVELRRLAHGPDEYVVLLVQAIGGRLVGDVGDDQQQVVQLLADILGAGVELTYALTDGPHAFYQLAALRAFLHAADPL